MRRMTNEARVLLALALSAGFVDALSYLGLGRVFTANMTGNTVLLGVAVAGGSSADALRALAALGGFVLGGGIGIALIGARHGSWSRLTFPVFTIEAAALGALLIIWTAVGVEPVRYLLVVLAGVAMGAQSAATRVSTVPGVGTTYMTSTLLNAVARIVLRDRQARQASEASHLPGLALAIYALGALAGAGAETAWHGAASAVPLAIVVAVTAVVLWRRERERRASDRPSPAR